MSLDKGIRVVRQLEDATFSDLGKRQPYIRVEFFVDDHGPFAERIPKDEFTADERDRRLNRFAREVKTS